MLADLSSEAQVSPGRTKTRPKLARGSSMVLFLWLAFVSAVGVK